MIYMNHARIWHNNDLDDFTFLSYRYSDKLGKVIVRKYRVKYPNDFMRLFRLMTNHNFTFDYHYSAIGWMCNIE